MPATERPPIDFAFLRQQITLEQVLRHLGLFDDLRGRAPQLRGRCPFHEGDRRQRTLSVHLAKNAFHCFQADCQAQGNALDFWAAYHRLPLYEAAMHLADKFHLYRNREEKLWKGGSKEKARRAAGVKLQVVSQTNVYKELEHDSDPQQGYHKDRHFVPRL